MRRVSSRLGEQTRLGKPAALLALGLAASGLAACGTVEPDDPNRATANTSGLGPKLLLGTANPTPLETPVDRSINRFCPPIEILDGASSYRVYETPGSTDPFALRWQASVAETARECSNLGVEAAVRVGVTGRVIVGPKGQSGAVRVPLRIALVDETGKPVYSQLHAIDVAIPAGAAQADFTKIDDAISVPIPANRFQGWRIVIGFDARAPAATAARRR